MMNFSFKKNFIAIAVSLSILRSMSVATYFANNVNTSQNNINVIAA